MSINHFKNFPVRYFQNGKDILKLTLRNLTMHQMDFMLRNLILCNCMNYEDNFLRSQRNISRLGAGGNRQCYLNPLSYNKTMYGETV